MSLPSYAKFYKNGKIVGGGFCNIGWFVHYDTMPGCIFEAWGHAIAHFDSPHDKEPDWHKELFTTREDLIDFDYVYLYDLCIDKHTVSSLYNKSLSIEEFSQKCEDGSFRINRYYNPIGLKSHKIKRK